MIVLILVIYIIGFSNGQPPDSPVAIIAQTLNNNSINGAVNQNANSSVVVPVGTLEKYHNATEPSFLYIVQLELKSSRVEESFTEIEKRLNKLVEMAFVLAAYKHRKQVPPAEITTANSGYSTKIVKKRTFGEVTYIHFVTYVDNELVLGEVVADDLTLLSVSQISAILRYPLGKIISDRDIEAESSTKWFWLIAIIGIGVFIILIGWCCLFLFYNSCGYMCGTEEDYFLTKKQRYAEPKLGADQPNDTLPSDGSKTTATKTQLNKTLPGPSRTLGEIYLENERENVRKAVEAYNKAAMENKRAPMAVPSLLGSRAVDTENRDVETAQRVMVAKSEKKKRHTKIGPITAVTTTTRTTNEQEGKMSEISRVSSVTTTSTDDFDGFDVSNLPETSLKIYKKKKGEIEPEVKSEPESDYGSSLEDEKSKDEDEIVKEIHEEVRPRPMTAKTQRTSLFGGISVSSLPVQPRAWTAYQAGDRVAEFWKNNNVNSYPTPSAPSENGIVQLSSNSFNFP